jgi:hypothetical protein
MKARSILALLLSSICCASAAAPFRAAATPDDGYLRQKVAILIFTAPSRSNLPDDASWIVVREIREFERYVWRNSKKKLRVETEMIRADRRLTANEFVDLGPVWGPLPDPVVASDLERMGWSRSQFDALLVLYESPAGFEPRVSGATYGPRGFSAIPLTLSAFQAGGRRYPLHLRLAREHLLQVEDAFAESTGRSYLLSPDRTDLRRVLQLNSEGSAVEWRRISPAAGSWVSAGPTP